MFVCLFVCGSVRAVNDKRLELSTPNHTLYAYHNGIWAFIPQVDKPLNSVGTVGGRRVYCERNERVAMYVMCLPVDASGAGEGQLAVDVTHDGRNVTSYVTAGQSGRYYVNFIPDRPGRYQIRVHFAGVEIAGIYEPSLLYGRNDATIYDEVEIIDQTK